jgi:hypothetical protein
MTQDQMCQKPLLLVFRCVRKQLLVSSCSARLLKFEQVFTIAYALPQRSYIF